MKGKVNMVKLITDEVEISRSEARRLLAQGGVKVDGAHVIDLELEPWHVEGKRVTVGRSREFTAPNEL